MDTIRIGAGTVEFHLGRARAACAEASERAVDVFTVGSNVLRQLEHVASHVNTTGRAHRFTVYPVATADTQLEAYVEPAGANAARVTFRHQASDWRELRETHLLRTAIDATRDVVLVTEAEPFPPRIVFANAAFAQMTGYSVDEVIGKTPKLLQGPRTDPSTQAYLRSRLRSWQPARAELVNYRKDGSEFVVELDITPVADETGWVTHWVAVQREVSERRKLEEERLLAGRMETLAALGVGAAHDFGNVLANIAATAWQIERRLTAGAASDVDAILEATKTITSAVMQGRALAKLLLNVPSWKSPSKETVQLARVVADMAELGRMGSPIDVVVVSDPSLWLEADPAEVGQLVLNLVINARGAMPDGGTLRIESASMQVDAAHPSRLPPGRYARLTVRDDGVGIPPENLERIFQPYFTTKPDGSGLGLALISVIVRRLRGHVSVTSEVGVFTEFEVLIPLAEAPTPKGN